MFHLKCHLDTLKCQSNVCEYVRWCFQRRLVCELEVSVEDLLSMWVSNKQWGWDPRRNKKREKSKF
jgi:hypothetical protein